MIPEIETRTDATSFEVFYSYSHNDEYYREMLDKHLSSLKLEGLITGWHDRKILAGEEWSTQINSQLEKADLFLLLVSPDFMASQYCYHIETKKAIEKHNAGKAYVLPIIIRPVDWSQSPLGNLQALPKDGKALSTWSNIDEGFLDVVQGIRKKISKLKYYKGEFESSVTRYTIRIDATLEVFDQDMINKILNQLKEMSGDPTIRIRNIKKGSVLLTLSGTKKGLQRLIELHEQNRLSAVLNLPVEAIFEVTETDLAQNNSGKTHSFYLGNLSWSITEQDLEAVFKKYGIIKKVVILRDKQSGRSKGFGFIEIETDYVQTIVDENNGLTLDGRSIIVNIQMNRNVNKDGSRSTSQKSINRKPDDRYLE